MSFAEAFELLTGRSPFPWQRRLYSAFTEGSFPKVCNIPTGLGKTSVMTVWLLALANWSRGNQIGAFPRRLVYVVNRRTVVDQSTREAERLVERLASVSGLSDIAEALTQLGAVEGAAPLAISTLRGQFADNAEWRRDPARPAIVVGTVDMIGSRLLFSGYGCGFRSKPLHAGFLGQDSLIVHDESHLEPAFQRLIESIESEQQRAGDMWPLRTIALSATPSAIPGPTFQIDSDDLANAEVERRVTAPKGIAITTVRDAKQVAKEIVRLALDHAKSKAAVLVFVRTIEAVDTVIAGLGEKYPTQSLTGILRGLERDGLATSDAVFARFMPDAQQPMAEGTVYLVCTSAGEIGVNISADHLVCDLAPLDSMIQRLGRVNRFGLGSARVDIVHGEEDLGDPVDAKTPLEAAGRATLRRLAQLPIRADRRIDGSPQALSALMATLTSDQRREACLPRSFVLAVDECLFDAWALTSIRVPMPGRPPVADWLHGVSGWEPPTTAVAWRDEVGIVSETLTDYYDPDDLIECFPLKPHEWLTDRTDRVRKHLAAISDRHPGAIVWVTSPDGGTKPEQLTTVVDPDFVLANCTILLPPQVGGLDRGRLNGSKEFDPALRYDVASEWLDATGRPRRSRMWNPEPIPANMRLVTVIDRHRDGPDDSEMEDKQVWRWYVRPNSADDDGSRSALFDQLLADHSALAEDHAQRLALRLRLPTNESAAVSMAARWHDLGKGRAVWQRSAGNMSYPLTVLAKSVGRMQPSDLSGYRHEFGSLLDSSMLPEFLTMPDLTRELTLHLIGAHHGRARPAFGREEGFDYQHDDATSDAAATEVPRRYARLQRRYGRWGLAFLESLLRAADALASQTLDKAESQT